MSQPPTPPPGPPGYPGGPPFGPGPPYPPHSQWAVPAAPRTRRPIRKRRVAAGIGAALLAHASTVLLSFLAANADRYGNSGDNAVIALLVGQGLVFFGCLVTGIVLVVRQEEGFGVGLMIGWAIGVVTPPVIGLGACLLILMGAAG